MAPAHYEVRQGETALWQKNRRAHITQEQPGEIAAEQRNLGDSETIRYPPFTVRARLRSPCDLAGTRWLLAGLFAMGEC